MKPKRNLQAGDLFGCYEYLYFDEESKDLKNYVVQCTKCGEIYHRTRAVFNSKPNYCKNCPGHKEDMKQRAIALHARNRKEPKEEPKEDITQKYLNMRWRNA